MTEDKDRLKTLINKINWCEIFNFDDLCNWVGHCVVDHKTNVKQ